MSISTTTASRIPARLGQLAERVHAASERLSGNAHAAGDAQARARGWTVTRTPGPLGLSGRAYRDPRFGTRRSQP